MSYQDTRVYNYLKYLETYLIGDLNTFHEVCKNCEEKEKMDANKGNPCPTISNSTGSLGTSLPAYGTTNHITSSFTTTQTTIMPRSGSSSTSGGDIFNLDKVPKYFRTTIPNTLTLFATIDLVGFLIGSGDAEATTNNFNQFFDGLSISAEKMNVLITVFRHGMTHGYFPKLNLGISYHSSNNGKDLFFKENGELVLNVNELENIVLQKLSNIMTNESLYTNMDGQFNKLMIKYENKVRTPIETLRGMRGRNLNCVKVNY